MSASDTTGGTSKPGAVIALCAAALLFAALVVVKIGLFADFRSDSSDGCFTEQNPQFVTACEQLAPASWFAPYLLSIVAYAVFAALFAAAAVLTARARPAAAAFTLVTTITAIVLAVLPGILDLGWRFAVATSTEGDKWVAEYVRDHAPTWYGPAEATALVIAALCAIAATVLLRRRASAQ
ncbi:hypothetical protein ACFQS3_23100 [Glycomyces mayteni]|uniref:Integral membrane protein n=1 Tax=Glycomyces mayteni TaxID=543887 RepID=A0ABW2DGX6_9ACTN|nr:hypothetical protein GCM10025732_38660 [Glycomyces mayteni]